MFEELKAEENQKKYTKYKNKNQKKTEDAHNTSHVAHTLASIIPASASCDIKETWNKGVASGKLSRAHCVSCFWWGAGVCVCVCVCGCVCGCVDI